jgi:hypothetical protein
MLEAHNSGITWVIIPICAYGIREGRELLQRNGGHTIPAQITSLPENLRNVYWSFWIKLIKIIQQNVTILVFNVAMYIKQVSIFAI